MISSNLFDLGHFDFLGFPCIFRYLEFVFVFKILVCFKLTHGFLIRWGNLFPQLLYLRLHLHHFFCMTWCVINLIWTSKHIAPHIVLIFVEKWHFSRVNEHFFVWGFCIICRSDVEIYGKVFGHVCFFCCCFRDDFQATISGTYLFDCGSWGAGGGGGKDWTTLAHHVGRGHARVHLTAASYSRTQWTVSIDHGAASSGEDEIVLVDTAWVERNILAGLLEHHVFFPHEKHGKLLLAFEVLDR